MNIDLIEYIYHAVGQGLFSTGALIARNGMGPCFRWAYDCGTASEQQLISDAFKRIDRPPFGTNAFDLVAISHFDADHISGLAKLLARFPVHTLMLPYVPLASRLALAFAQGVEPGSAVFRFFIDPVGYIRALEGGGRIKRILLVPPAGEEGPEPPIFPDSPADPEPAGEAPSGGARGETFDLSIDAAPLGDAESAELLLGPEAAGDLSLSMLAPGGRLQFAGIWEFVPYNNAERAPPDLASFAHAVSERRDALLSAAQAWRAGQGAQHAIDAKIVALKQLYDDEFGRSATDRNIISLFLYAGPLPALHYKYWKIIYSPYINHHLRDDEDFKFAQLSTGDGYLDTPQRLDALVNYLSPQRIARVGVFQVMHHGAQGNWHSGVAARIAPIVSVFSSDPDRGGTFHPHAPVLRDFWPYGPARVDKSRSCEIDIRIR